MNKPNPSFIVAVFASLFVVPSLAIDESSLSAQTPPTATSADVVAAVDQNSQVEVVYAEGELEQLLAPIALYPDSLLTHILIASTYPLEIIEADRWLNNHQGLDADQVIEQAQDKDWDPSVKALLPFEQVLSKLSEEINWTKQIGDAFLEAEEQVLASIQSLRAQADEAGNLEKMENTKVTRVEKTIVIEPATPEVIYVPYYDTRVVYGPWYWHHYPPVHWHHPHHEHYLAFHHHNPFYWHSGVHVSVGILFGSFHWHNHHVIVHHDHHYYRHHGHHHRGHHGGHHGGHHNKHHKKHDSHGKKHYAHSSKKHASSGGKRWRHEPSHRKGVAYRTDRTAREYKSNRYSVQQSKRMRAQENLKAVNYDRKNHMSNAFSGNKSKSLNRSAAERSANLRTDVTNANKRGGFNKSKDIGRQTAQMRQDNFKQKLNRSPVNRNKISKQTKYDRNNSRLNKASLNKVERNVQPQQQGQKGKASSFKRSDSSVYQTRYAKTRSNLQKSVKTNTPARANYQAKKNSNRSLNTRSKAVNTGSKAVNNDLSRAFNSSKQVNHSARTTVQRQAKVTSPRTIQRASVQRSTPTTVNRSVNTVNRSANRSMNRAVSTPKVSNSYRSTPKMSSMSRASKSFSSSKMSIPRMSPKSISRGPSSRGRMSRK